jgi:heat shock protein HslJ
MRPLLTSRRLRNLVACAVSLPLASVVTCTASDHSGHHAVALEGTYWQLTRLHDSGVVQVPPPRGAHLLLEPESHRVSGSGGCNRLMGTYQIDGRALTLGPLATTRMACLEGGETETEFLSALTRVTGWRIEARALALSDSAGKTLAQFEARDTNSGK